MDQSQTIDLSSPHLLPLRQAISVLRSPYLGGVVIAFFVITRFWPAGFDAQLYFLRWPPPEATTPYWVYLITYPLSWLGWPLSWQVLIAATILTASVVYALRGNFRWWIIVFSSAMIFNAWWGQVEIFSILGLVVGLSVLDRKLHPAWLGIGWLLLAIKIQSNYGLILLLTFWFWRQRGFRQFLPPALVSLGVFALTMVIWPMWVLQLFKVYSGTYFGFANASLWPWGLIAWPLVLLHHPQDASQRIRMVAAASLLGSPYFTLHHCLTLMVLTDNPIQLVFSWLPMVMIWQTRDWSMYAWIIPIGILLIDFASPFFQSYRLQESRE